VPMALFSSTKCCRAEPRASHAKARSESQRNLRPQNALPCWLMNWPTNGCMTLNNAVTFEDGSRDEAEAVAYVVCTSFGLNCSTRSSDYIQMYRGDEATLIASLDRIQRTSSRMIHSLSEATTVETEEPLEAMTVD
jgi:hypothetical protein